MIDPQLSRYGLANIAEPAVNPAAKIHYVGLPSLSWYGDFISAFSNDVDGENRVFPTLTAALANASVVADRGDVIYLLPGYTQTITAAAGVSITKSGLTIKGLGNGTLRPTFTFTTATAASFDISAANTLIKNVIFTTGINSQAAITNVTGAYVAFEDCEFNTNSGTVGAVTGILTAATATGLRVENCRFVGPATNSGTTTTAQIKHESGTDYIIRNNYFTGKMTQAIVNVATILRGLIDSNRFVVATGTSAITMAAASTPFITNNRMNVASGTAPVTSAAGFMAGNTYSAAAGVTAGTASTF
jgi:hypothetical protein